MNTQEKEALVLEILKQEEVLKMSLFEKKELTSSLRHYSQCNVSSKEINRLCLDAISILNKADKNGVLGAELIKSLMNTGQLLWDHLLTKPIKERLKSLQNRDLLLFIDEELIDIPWELLCDGENFLCFAFNLGRLVRTKREVNQVKYRSPSGILKMLVLVNPTEDLKGAYAEGINIKNQLDRKRSSVHVNFKSTHIDRLYVKKNLRDYDIVHFAGHCEYDSSDPQSSGWVLSDGRFTIEDILVMGTTLSLPSLVFSNACYSAKADLDFIGSDYQEENYSLAQAFLFSGVRQYVGTMRKIEDSISLVFAKEFYANLISGNSVGEALRLSRKKLIKEYGITSVHWASYILYGDPGFVLFKPKEKQSGYSPRKYTAFIKKYKKHIAYACLAVSIVVAGLLLYARFSFMNPNAYVLYLKSKNKFLAGENQEAILLCNNIIRKDPLFLSAYPLLADTYRRIGDRENALKNYFEYALQSERKRDEKNLVSAYICLGWFYHLDGQYEKAADFYNKALLLSRKNKDRLNEADVLGKLAVWYMDKEDYDKALELLTKSAEINREKSYIYKHRYNLACDYFNLGLLFTNKDDYDTAREFYDKSFVLFKRMKLTHELSDYYFNVGEIYSFQKEYQKAMDCYLKGLKIDQEQNHKPNIASDYMMIGELYLEMDRLLEAEDFFKRSVEASEEINAKPELAWACRNLGLLYKKINRKNKAREYFRKAQEIYKQIDENKYQEIKAELLTLDNI